MSHLIEKCDKYLREIFIYGYARQNAQFHELNQDIIGVIILFLHTLPYWGNCPPSSHDPATCPVYSPANHTDDSQECDPLPDQG